MKNVILLIFTFCLFFDKAYCDKPGYEIKAYQGVCFYCHIFYRDSCPRGCQGIILGRDSTILDVDNEKAFFKSLFRDAKYMQDSELFYLEAYNILFPEDDDMRLKNYEIAADLNIDFNDLYRQNEKEIGFSLTTGAQVRISYCKVKGFFLSVYDERLARDFETSLDVGKSKLPHFDSVNIPLTLFECLVSDHKFIINGQALP